MNVYIGLIFIAFIPIILLNSNFFGKKLSNMQKDAMIKQDNYLSVIKSTVDSKREINILEENEFFYNEFKNNNYNWIKHMKKYRFFELLLNHLPGIFLGIYSVFYLYISAILVKNEFITLGTFLMMYQILGLITTPVSRISEIISRRKALSEHIKKVDSLLQIQEENINHQKLQIETDYILKTNDFSLYTEKEQQNLLYSTADFNIPNKGLFVLKGDNGTGKSMLVNFILGYLDTELSSGSFSVEKDINNNSCFLTYPNLFIDGSFKKNIFNNSINEKILSILNIDFADRIIKTNPINLSLGQQQKISLLRTLNKNKKNYFLDEPFSNLDIDTQHKILKHIKTTKADNFFLIIMHDDTFDTIADGIINIKNQEISIVYN